MAAAAAVTLLVVACVMVAVEAWQYSRFEQELEDKGFIVLDDALGKCIQGCHAAGESIHPLPDFPHLNVPFPPFRHLPDFPFPGRPFPGQPLPGRPVPGRPFPMPDIEVGGPRWPPRDPHDEPEERRDRRNERRRRTDPRPEIDTHPHERREPPDPCDMLPLHTCGDAIKTYAAAAAELAKPPGSTTHKREAANGDCFADGKARGKNDPLGRLTLHETWYAPDKNRVGTIKCCPCCVRGGRLANPVAQHCSVIL